MATTEVLQTKSCGEKCLQGDECPCRVHSERARNEITKEEHEGLAEHQTNAGCDCQFVEVNLCAVCEATPLQAMQYHVTIAGSSKRLSGDVPIDTSVCGSCMILIMAVVGTLQQQGKWQGIVEREIEKAGKLGGLITPNKRIIAPGEGGPN